MSLLQSLRLSLREKHTLFRNALGAVRPVSSQPRSDSDPLFCYTNGRWLWNEPEQLRARYRRFNVPALQNVACQAISGGRCKSIEKIGEGNFNKAFRLEMDNGKRVVCKIPHPNAGPPVLTTSSEVATMEFVRDVLDVPVPRVFAWSADEQNPVQTEYIIMEEARGTQLHKIWQDLSLQKKDDIIREVVEIERKLLSVSFDKFGSLYFSDSGINGCEPVAVQIAPQGKADHIASRYCIGPITQKSFWREERSRTSSTAYLESITRRKIHWIQAYADTHKPVKTMLHYTAEQQTPEAHTALLQKFLSVIPLITPQDPELVSFRLWHPDFHAGNIYIDDEGQITYIIDWQGARTSPAFLGANPPLLLDYGVDLLMKLPDDFKEFDDALKDDLRYRVSQSVLIHTYETSTAKHNPLMHKVIRHPHGQTLKYLEASVGSTWKDGFFPLEECLIRVEREWGHFNTKIPCPFHFSSEQIQRHDEEADLFNSSQEFWRSLQGVLTDEGFTLHETFDQACAVLNELRAAGLRELKGDERRKFDEETAWLTSS